MASQRATFRLFQNVRNSYRTSTFKQAFRRQTTAANPAVEAPKQSAFQRLWTSEVGIKTVHFWAPVMKWGVVLAGVGDFFRPAEKLSLTQNLALMATGSIWTRWCFVIRPQNMFLAAVNFCLFCVGTVQVSRILVFQSSQKGSKEAAVKALTEEEKESAESVGKEAKKELA